jgi:hypothetical protein
MIKVLSLCAALLAPESSGQDPHGRSLHLKLNADFNTSYEACITTLKQARKYKIDPFVSAALLYKTTKFSPKLAKKSPIFKKINDDYGCEGSQGQFIRSSCSPFVLFAPHLVTILEKSRRHVTEPENYRKSLRIFLRNNRKQAKIVENMAKRFADVYSRTHTYFAWKNPFTLDDEIDEDRQLLDDMVTDLRQPQPYDPYNMSTHQRMEGEFQILYTIFGNQYKIEAKSHNRGNPEYYIHANYQNLKEFLWFIAGNTSSTYKPRSLQEYEGQRFVLHFHSPRMRLVLTPMEPNLFNIMIKW